MGSSSPSPKSSGDERSAPAFDPLDLDLDTFGSRLDLAPEMLLEQLRAATAEGHVDDAHSLALALAWQNRLPYRLLLLHRLRLVALVKGEDLDDLSRFTAVRTSLEIVRKASTRADYDVDAFTAELWLCLAEESLALVRAAIPCLVAWAETSPNRLISTAELEALRTMNPRHVVYLLCKVRCDEDEGRLSSRFVSKLFGVEVGSIDSANSRVIEKIGSIGSESGLLAAITPVRPPPEDTQEKTDEPPRR